MRCLLHVVGPESLRLSCGQICKIPLSTLIPHFYDKGAYRTYTPKSKMSTAPKSSWNPFLLLSSLMTLNGAVFHAVDGHKHRLPPLRELEGAILSKYSISSVGHWASMLYFNWLAA